MLYLEFDESVYFKESFNLMIKYLLIIYRIVFAKPMFLKWNKFLYRLSLSGLGILNYENTQVSGELYFLNMLKSKLKSTSIILDVGANKGDYSLMCAGVFQGAQIYSFEPHPVTFSKLIINVAGTNICCVNKALGDKCDVIDIFDYIDEDGSSHASIYRDVIEKIHHRDSISRKVNMTTIDEFIKNNNLSKINLLKIDTEGNEYQVLLGASCAIKRKIIDVIHFEFNEMNVVSRVFCKDFYELLKGYAFYRLLPSGMIPLNYSPLTAEIFAYQNIVAISERVKFQIL